MWLSLFERNVLSVHRNNSRFSKSHSYKIYLQYTGIIDVLLYSLLVDCYCISLWTMHFSCTVFHCTSFSLMGIIDVTCARCSYRISYVFIAILSILYSNSKRKFFFCIKILYVFVYIFQMFINARFEQYTSGRQKLVCVKFRCLHFDWILKWTNQYGPIWLAAACWQWIAFS